MLSQETSNVFANASKEDIVLAILEATGIIHDRPDAMEIVDYIESECNVTFDREDNNSPMICKKKVPNPT